MLEILSDEQILKEIKPVLDKYHDVNTSVALITKAIATAQRDETALEIVEWLRSWGYNEPAMRLEQQLKEKGIGGK